MRIETIPSPENDGGRRTARQATIFRVRWRPEIREAKRERGSQPDARPRTSATAYARGVEESTTRAVAPFWRALTYWPSSLSVRATFRAAGSATSTSVMSVWLWIAAIFRRAAPGRATGSTGSAGLAFWITSSRGPCSSRSPPARLSASDPTIRGAPGPLAATA